MAARRRLVAVVALAVGTSACWWGDEDVAAALQTTVASYESPAGWTVQPPEPNHVDGYDRVHGAELCRDRGCLTGSLRHDVLPVEAIDLAAVAASVRSIDGVTDVTPPPDCDLTNLDDQPCEWIGRAGDLVAEVRLRTSRSGPEPTTDARLLVTVVHEEYMFLDQILDPNT